MQDIPPSQPVATQTSAPVAGVPSPARTQQIARGFDDDPNLLRGVRTARGRMIQIASFAAAERQIRAGANSRDVLIARHGDLDAAEAYVLALDPEGPVEPETPHDLGLRLLVCLPTYNEAENLESMVRAIRTWLKCDILVIDDGSPDGTGEIADRLAAEHAEVHVLHKKNKAGLGPAYLAGFAWGLERGYDRLFEIDCDFSHAPWDLPRLAYAGLDNELVIGSRYVPGGGTDGWAFSRRMLSRGANLYTKFFLGFGVGDYTAGYRCYDADLLRKLNLSGVSASGYSFQVEMTWRSKRAGASIREVPIRFVDRVEGQSKMDGSIAREALLLIPRLRFKR